MKLKFAALPLMIFSATVAAEEYTSFSSAAYSQTETQFFDADQYQIGSTYYFSPKNTIGPLKEFEYINKASNIFGAYSNTDFETGFGSGDFDSTTIGGEYFAANGFVVGGSMESLDDVDVNTISVGYLFSPDFLVSLTNVDADNSDNQLFVDARYNHQLNGTDYIGFDFSVDDELDSRSLSSKYFKDLGGETYLALTGAYVSDDNLDDDFWSVGAEYYFSKMTSVGFTYDETEMYSLGVSHFFTRNVAASFAYSSTNDDFDLDQYLLGLTVQL